MSALYNIVIQGKALTGRKNEEVQTNLAILFKKPTKKMEYLLSGKPIIIKKKISRDHAVRIAQMIKKTGAECKIVKYRMVSQKHLSMKKNNNADSTENGTKQYIIGLTTLIFYLPFFYYLFIKTTGKDWRIVIVLFLLVFTPPLFFKLLWGKEVFKKANWEEEGFSGFWDWYKNSKKFFTKFFRFSIILVGVLFIVSILFGIIIALL